MAAILSSVLLSILILVSNGAIAKKENAKKKEIILDAVVVEPTEVYKFLDAIGIVSQVNDQTREALENNAGSARTYVEVVQTSEVLGVDSDKNLVSAADRVRATSARGDVALANLKNEMSKEMVVEAFNLPQEAKKLPSATDMLTVLSMNQIGLEAVRTDQPSTWNDASKEGVLAFGQRHLNEEVARQSGSNPPQPQTTPEHSTPDRSEVMDHARSGSQPERETPAATASGGTATIEVTEVLYAKDLSTGITTVSATYTVTYSDGTKETKTEVVGTETADGKSYNYDYGDKKCVNCHDAPKPGDTHTVQDTRQAQTDAKDAKDAAKDGTQRPNPMSDVGPKVTVWAVMKGKNGNVILPISQRGIKDPSPMAESGPVRSLWSLTRKKIFWDIQVRRGVYDPSPISDSGFVGTKVKFTGVPTKIGAAVDRPIMRPTHRIDPRKLIKPYAKNMVPVSRSPSSTRLAASLNSHLGSAQIPAGTTVQIVIANGKLTSVNPIGGSQMSGPDLQKLKGAFSKWVPPAGTNGTFAFQLSDKP